MGFKEHNLIVDYITKQGSFCRMFRANAGMAWVGTIINKTADSITLKNARPLHGLPKGFPDTFGFESVIVSEEMVGKRIAIFKCAEFKTGKLKLTEEQSIFKNLVEKMGGIFEVIRG